MNPESFRSDAAGKVIRVGQGNKAYSAFLPNPLPPVLEPDWSLIETLSLADRAVSELSGLGRTLPNPNLFIRPFLRREAVLSSRIEGTRSDLTDLYRYEGAQLVLPWAEPASTEGDVREVFNYVRALETGLSQLADTRVNLWVLRGLHRILLEGVRGEYATPGEFRTRQNWIGGNTINDAIYVPPPVIELEPALQNLEKYLYQENTYPPLIRLALIHYQFEAIHPFVDGNGRIGRLLLSLLLVSWKLLPLPLLHLSAYFERHRSEYYDRLLAVSQQGAWAEWVRFFLQGTASQAADTNARIKRLQDLQQAWHDRLAVMGAAHSAHQLVDFLFEEPILTVPRVQQVLELSHRGATLVVQKLIDQGLVVPADRIGHTQQYLSPEILEAVRGDLSAAE